MDQEGDEPETSELAEWNTHCSQCTTAFIKGRHFHVGKRRKLHNNNMVRIMLILDQSAELDIYGSETALKNQTTGKLGRLQKGPSQNQTSTRRTHCSERESTSASKPVTEQRGFLRQEETSVLGAGRGNIRRGATVGHVTVTNKASYQHQLTVPEP